ncbi:MAG: hypothetical protein MRY74_14560 [Neomegalonema sp.]|nr:hypothetical protein [Neomegalonema sp.]
MTDRLKAPESESAPVALRIRVAPDPNFLRELDAWRERQSEQMTRAEAVRHLTRLGIQHDSTRHN